MSGLFTSFTTTPTRFTGLIVKQQQEQQSTMGGEPVFRAVVESPKGQACIVRDLFGAFYLWISKRGEHEIPIVIIAISTIQYVDSKKVRSKNESHERGKVCFTANCQAFPVGECQQAAAFQVMLPLPYFEEFVNIVKDGIKQPNGFSSFAIKQGTVGTMKSFLHTDEAYFRDLIIHKKNVHGGQVSDGTEHTKEFYEIVECPKGQIKIVKDYFRAEYLWVSKNNMEQHVACIIPVSTIRDVKAWKVHGKNRIPAPDSCTGVPRQPLVSQVTRLCRRVQVEFTASCQSPTEDCEFQHGAVFRVKLDNASYNKFWKKIGGLSKKEQELKKQHSF